MHNEKVVFNEDILPRGGTAHMVRAELAGRRGNAKTEQLFIEKHTGACCSGRANRTRMAVRSRTIRLQRKPCRLPKSCLRTHRFVHRPAESRHTPKPDEEFCTMDSHPDSPRVMAYARAHWRATNVRARPASGRIFARLAFATRKKRCSCRPSWIWALDLRQNMRGEHYRANPARVRHVSRKEERGYMLSWDYLCWVRGSDRQETSTHAVHSLRRK